MKKNESRLTVYFEDPFWVGVYEHVSQGQLTVCKITFGPEPKDYEVYDFLLQHWHQLRFSRPVTGEKLQHRVTNPKRLQRSIQKKLQEKGVGTKSQKALKQQQEENKILGKQKSRAQKQAEQQRQFALRQEKRKQKHRGH